MPMTMDERLDHARAALGAYFAEKGEYVPSCDGDYDDTDVSDLIADLLHLQKYLGLRDTERTLATALMHFEAEQEEYPDAAEEKLPLEPAAESAKVHNATIESNIDAPRTAKR